MGLGHERWVVRAMAILAMAMQILVPVVHHHDGHDDDDASPSVTVTFAHPIARQTPAAPVLAAASAPGLSAPGAPALGQKHVPHTCDLCAALAALGTAVPAQGAGLAAAPVLEGALEPPQPRLALPGAVLFSFQARAPPLAFG